MIAQHKIFLESRTQPIKEAAEAQASASSEAVEAAAATAEKTAGGKMDLDPDQAAAAAAEATAEKTAGDKMASDSDTETEAMAEDPDLSAGAAAEETEEKTAGDKMALDSNQSAATAAAAETKFLKRQVTLFPDKIANTRTEKKAETEKKTSTVKKEKTISTTELRKQATDRLLALDATVYRRLGDEHRGDLDLCTNATLQELCKARDLKVSRIKQPELISALMSIEVPSEEGADGAGAAKTTSPADTEMGEGDDLVLDLLAKVESIKHAINEYSGDSAFPDDMRMVADTFHGALEKFKIHLESRKGSKQVDAHEPAKTFNDALGHASN